LYVRHQIGATSRTPDSRLQPLHAAVCAFTFKDALHTRLCTNHGANN
jgi:hypothetical protein